MRIYCFRHHHYMSSILPFINIPPNAPFRATMMISTCAPAVSMMTADMKFTTVIAAGGQAIYAGGREAGFDGRPYTIYGSAKFKRSVTSERGHMILIARCSARRYYPARLLCAMVALLIRRDGHREQHDGDMRLRTPRTTGEYTRQAGSVARKIGGAAWSERQQVRGR